MYSAASRPPRVPGARPSSRSELRKRMCASISLAAIAGRLCAGNVNGRKSSADSGATKGANHRFAVFQRTARSSQREARQE